MGVTMVSMGAMATVAVWGSAVAQLPPPQLVAQQDLAPMDIGRFQVRFPDAPEPLRYPLPWGDQVIEVQGYRLETKEVAFSATYVTIPGGVEDADVVADAAVRGAADQLVESGTLISQLPVADGAGRRLTGTTATGLALEMHFICADNTLYTLSVLAESPAASAIASRAFFQSFAPKR